MNDAILQAHIDAAIAFLREHGYTVVPGKLPDLPWDKTLEKFILQALRTNLQQEAQESVVIRDD